MAVIVIAVLALLLIVLAILWRLKPTKLRISLKLTRLFHFEVESESAG